MMVFVIDQATGHSFNGSVFSVVLCLKLADQPKSKNLSIAADQPCMRPCGFPKQSIRTNAVRIIAKGEVTSLVNLVSEQMQDRLETRFLDTHVGERAYGGESGHISLL